MGQSGKIMISFTGNGGNGRIALDDLVIPSLYASDPTKNCTLDTTVKPEGDITSSLMGTSGYSTLMFEDLWPGLGDYDFNDLVLGIKGEKITTSKGVLKEIQLTILPRAAGAAFDNSFGIAFPHIPVGAVDQVTGTVKGNSEIFNYLANGAEANQTNLTVIVLENVRTVIPSINNPLLIGGTTSPEVAPIRISIKIKESANIQGSLIQAESMNPFLIANQERGREIHLPGKSATDLVNPSLFGTAADNSMNGTVNYTAKDTNLPWAILVPDEVPFMQEQTPITEGFLKMSEWAKSKGNNFTDWFMDKPSYREKSKFFTK
ncbi:LruC domain-containing protein [Nitritalea halalkaliphila]|nr:LruC domain-containing protein [Nitritalea halalkaliphila]